MMTVREQGIEEIEKYKEDFIFSPSANWPSYEFKMRSYQTFAVNLVLSKAKEHPEKSITSIVTDIGLWADDEMYNDHTNEGYVVLGIIRDIMEEFVFILA